MRRTTILLIVLSTTLTACLKTKPPEPDNRQPVRETLRYPGKPFSHVLMGSIYPGEDFQSPDAAFNAPAPDQEGLLLGKPKQLIPAHQGDLLVGLYWQDVFTPEIPRDEPRAYDFAFFFMDDKDEPVAHFRFATGSMVLSLDGGKRLLLTSKGYSRISRVINESSIRY